MSHSLKSNVILDGKWYWPQIYMDDSPETVDEDLGVDTKGKRGPDPLNDGPDNVRSGSSGEAVAPS